MISIRVSGLVIIIIFSNLGHMIIDNYFDNYNSDDFEIFPKSNISATEGQVTISSKYYGRTSATIVINEFMPDPNSDWDGDLTYNSADDEWVELFNYGTQPVEISGWNISDSASKRYGFPDGLIIPPGGYYVAFGSNSSLALTNTGDTVMLMNSTDEIIDSFTYELSYNDISIGRLPDGAPNWTEFNEPTPGKTNGQIPKIVVNEVMYNPSGNDVDYEWLEIFNNDSKAINMTNWQLTDQDGGVDYIFGSFENPHPIFPPQKYIVIHTSEGTDDFDFSDGLGHLYMAKTSAMLNNDGDDILLTDRGGLQIDYVAFGNSTYIDPPPAASDWDGMWYDASKDEYNNGKPNPTTDIDCTIRLIQNGQDTNSVLNWGNASGLDITQGRNNNEIIGLEIFCENPIQYVNTSEQATYIINLSNLGNIPLHIQIGLSEANNGWSAELSHSIIDLASKTNTSITLSIYAPSNINHGNELRINVSIEARNVNFKENLTITTIIPVVDLEIIEFEIDGSTSILELIEGEIVQLKATIKNLGILTSSGFNVGFYYNEIDQEHLVGIKNYDYIYANGYKYPSVYWDTLDCSGNYTIIVVVDPENIIDEPNENNNRQEYQIFVNSTTPSLEEMNLLIIEVYYDPKLPYDPDEFVHIYNPTNSILEISGWQLTDDPKSNTNNVIEIPENTWLKSMHGVYITNDAESFLTELGFEPDFAAIPGKSKNVMPMVNPKNWPALSNSGDLVVLRDEHRHIIDMVSYGASDASAYPSSWHGQTISTVPEGKLLKRQRSLSSKQGEDGKFIDTNTAMDWQGHRLYGIGQSDFYPQVFTVSGEVIPFVSPEASFTTIRREIENASNYIYLNLYEFTHPLLMKYLLKALDRGVTLHILIEGNPVSWNFTNIEDPSVEKNEEYTQKYILTQLYSAGAKIKFLTNIKNDHKISTLNKRYNYDHAKYAIIDDLKTIVMSGNWNPMGVPKINTFGNREWGVVINDFEVAKYFKEVFETDWAPASELQNDTHWFDLTSEVYGQPPSFFNLNYTHFTGSYEPITEFTMDNTYSAIHGAFSVEPVLSPDTSARTDSGILRMINDAKDIVCIQQMDCNLDWVLTHGITKQLTFNWSDPEHYYLNWADGNNYFNEYLTATIDAARRGCKVKILLDIRYVELDTGPGMIYEDSKMDNFDTVQYINKVARLENLTDNLEARLNYLVGLDNMHNKGILVDGKKVLISSINWNYNSVVNNRETGVIIENSELTKYYSSFFDHDWQVSKSINKPKPLNASEKAVLITEFYADTYLSYEPDEYVAIYNPSNNLINIGGWIITDKLTSFGSSEGGMLFPVGTKLIPKTTIFIARNASAFNLEHNFLPDFEFLDDSLPEVPQMELSAPSESTSRGLRLSNNGDEIVLGDEYLFNDQGFEHEHIIDMVVYGNSTYISDFNNVTYPFNTGNWVGESICKISEGEIVKRNREEIPTDYPLSVCQFLDTDSAVDWENNRIYYPGQSDFKFNAITYTGSVTVFSSPDSSYKTISTELENAQYSIYLSVYQFHDPYLMDKLINASARGVEVKVFLDGAPVGGVTDSARFVAQQLVDHGCEVRFLRSLTKEDIHRRYRFLHAKYAVIDNFTTIVMSENWKSTGVSIANTAGNRGWGIVLRNAEIAKSYAQVFFHDWNPARKDSYAFNATDDKYGAPPEDFIISWSVFDGYYKPRFNSRTINGAFKITPVIAPDTTLNKYRSILEMINSATKSVYIEQLDCYINWNTKGRNIKNLYLSAAIEAARRGCEVKILLDSAFTNPLDPGLDNYDTVEYINSVAKAENLTHNLKAKLIYLYGTEGKNELDKVHNKGIIVDGTKTLISSINWVTGSTIYNREAGVIIENSEVAEFYTKIFNYDWNLTVNELLKTYVLHSNIRDINPGETTEYVISFMNTQPLNLTVNLSITGMKPGWNYKLDLDSIILPAVDLSISETSAPIEVRLSVITPSQDFLNQIKNSSTAQMNYESHYTFELGLRAETLGMASDIIFTTTNILKETKPDDDSGDQTEKPIDRSVIDPWLVIVLLSLLIIIGAVARDIIHSRLEKKKKIKKASKTKSGKDKNDMQQDADAEE